MYKQVVLRMYTYRTVITLSESTQQSSTSLRVATTTADLPWGILFSRFHLIVEALPTENVTPVLIVVPHGGLLAHIALQKGEGRGEGH